MQSVIGLNHSFGLSLELCPQGGGASLPLAVMIYNGGNSHGIGRAPAESDAFPAEVLQWTQAGALAAPAAAILDFDDGITTADMFSPDITFAEDFLAANPSVAKLVFVPNNRSSTGFFDGTWNAVDTPNRLSEGVERWNDCWAALIAEGYQPVAGCAFHHSANPDYSDSTYDVDRAYIDGMIAYLRANCQGFTASTPIVIGGGMNNSQLNGGPTDTAGTQIARNSNDHCFQMNRMGAEQRQAHVASYNTIDNSFGYSTGLPIPQYDAIHANRAGDMTKGHLRYLALVRAKANASLKFRGLSFMADLAGLWDFGTGGPEDLSGNGHTLDRIDVPVLRWNTKYSRPVWRRTAGTRLWNTPAGLVLPQSYTKFVYVQPSSIASAISFIQDTTVASAAQHRFQFSQTNNDIRAGHGATADHVTYSAAFLNTTDFHFLAVAYDAATQVMRLFVNGAQVASASSVPNHAATTGGYLGGNATNATFVGDWMMAGMAERSLTNAELAEANSACLTLPSYTY